MKSGLAGAAYGVLLLSISLAIADAGHGFLTPLFVSVAPVPLVLSPFLAFRLVLVTLVLPPLLWGTMAVLGRDRRRWLFPTATGVHYLSAAVYAALAWHDDVHYRYEGLRDVVKFEALRLIAFAAVYVGGQFWLWRSFAECRRPVDTIQR